MADDEPFDNVDSHALGNETSQPFNKAGGTDLNETMGEHTHTHATETNEQNDPNDVVGKHKHNNDPN